MVSEVSRICSRCRKASRHVVSRVREDGTREIVIPVCECAADGRNMCMVCGVVEIAGSVPQMCSICSAEPT